MTPSKQSSKIEQSLHFQRIVELYREHKGTLSKKAIFNTYIQPLDPSLRYHQFIRLTVKLDGQVIPTVSKAIAHIDEAVGKLTVSEKFKEWAIKYLHEIRQTQAQTHEAALKNSEREHLRITQQLDNLLLKYSSPENMEGQLISDQQYQDLRTRLLKQKAALEGSITVRNREIDEWLELSERTFNFARYARVWFARGDMDVKRAIFACLGSNLIVKDQKVAITLRPVFKTIFEMLPKVESEIAHIRTYQELEKTFSINDKSALVGRKISNLRRVQDLNLRGACAPTGFQDQRLKPLGQPSKLSFY